MWRVLRWVLLALGLSIAALLALPFFLPTSVYKEQIVEQVRLATGRDLEIDGDLRISIWPALGVEVNKVRFANVAGAQEPDMASMEQLVVGAELWPLLSGSLKVTEVRLVKPVIHLEIDKQGRGNWLFEPAATRADAPADGAQQAPPAAAGDFSFQDVQLSEGTLTYSDARAGTAQRVDAINAAVKLPSLDQPMAFAGGLTWNTEAITINTEIASPRALSTGGKSALKAKIEGEVLNASFEGDVDAVSSAIDGKIDFRTTSARRLAAWAGVALPKVRGFGAMTLTGDMTSGANRIAFKNAKLSFDGMSGSGNLSLDTGRAVPYVKGDFTLDRLDLNPYMGSGEAKTDTPSKGVAAWSAAPIDFAALKLVDADFDFAVNALSVGGLKIGRSALDIALAGGKLRATLKQLALYGGNGSGLISLNGAGSVPQFGLDLKVAGVQGEPFLTDAAGFTRLSGTGSIVAKIAGSGRSQQAWMKSLGGAASIKFEDGAIKGVNLAEIARTIQSVLTGSAVGGAAKTDFAEMSGSFVIQNGVAANKDFKLLNPFVRLNGAGIIDIGNQTLDYRVEPKAVSSIKGQGGETAISGLGIPFRIKGPWSNPSYSPDLSGVVDSAIDKILKGENPLDDIKNGGFEGLIPGLGGKPAPPESAPDKAGEPKKKPKSENPLDPLKGLLGGDR